MTTGTENRAERGAEGPGRLRRWIFRLTAILVTFLLGCGLLEVGLRIAGYSPAQVNPWYAFHEPEPVLGYRGRPSFAGRFKRPDFDVWIVHGDDGFRAPKVPVDPERAERRIYVLGDSYVWGWGVEQGEVLTDRLAETLPGTAVLNRGVSGSNTCIQHEIFRSSCAPRLRPGDAVVLFFCSNDFEGNLKPKILHARCEGDEVRTLPPDGSFRRTIRGWIQEHSYLLGLIAYVWNYGRLVRANEADVARNEQLPALGNESPEVKVTEHYLRDIRDLCREKKARFILAGVPETSEMSPRTTAGEKAPHRETLLGIADRLGVEMLDPVDDFYRAQEGSGKPLHFPRDKHWNAEGHRVMARLVAERLAAPPAGN